LTMRAGTLIGLDTDRGWIRLENVYIAFRLADHP
jgi:hypothetical protein